MPSYWERPLHKRLLTHIFCRKNVLCHILFKGIYFVLSYSTQRWNAYVAEDLPKNKKPEKCRMPITKT